MVAGAIPIPPDFDILTEYTKRQEKYSMSQMDPLTDDGPLNWDHMMDAEINKMHNTGTYTKEERGIRSQQANEKIERESHLTEMIELVKKNIESLIKSIDKKLKSSEHSSTTTQRTNPSTCHKNSGYTL